MNLKRVIFCLPKDIDIVDFSSMVDWAYGNPMNNTVVMLSNFQVENYEKLGVWEKVSEITENWLFGLGEDDWLIDMNVIKAVRENLVTLAYKDNYINKIVFILDYAISYNRTVIFYL